VNEAIDRGIDRRRIAAAASRLVEVLKDVVPRSRPMHLVYLQDR